MSLPRIRLRDALAASLIVTLAAAAALPMFLVPSGAIASNVGAQAADTDSEPGDAESGDAAPEPMKLESKHLAALRVRSIGPALMSGRIGDIAVNPENPSEWYVAACSGGVWKTHNHGTTFRPIFDGEGSYSIGCLAIDPNDPNVVWVGTGENNSQRSVSFGDGLYKSVDAGKSWKKVGLAESEHIGRIAIDPRDSDTVFVAAQGPLWRSGGDRGLYKTTDGGATWRRVLHVSEDTGINEVHLSPDDPDTLYASSYQRRRHVWTLVNGGPESSVYKSTDGGETWREIRRGLPGVDMGRIGLDVSPADPDVLYAVVEAARGKSGFYRSTDRGETWQRRSGYISSSPQYYNEILCDPEDVDRVYALDTYMQVTTDGGASFRGAGQRDRHVDDHALWIDPEDPTHMIVGCDGGVYQSWDRAENWRFCANLPLTQFYKICTDNAEPFYHVYGGTQDNNTQGGPTRTTDRAGISNADWFVTLGGDGFEPQVDPTDPMIVYSQYQYGGLARHDRRSGEIVDIKPREKPGEAAYVWNWDSPLLISPHSPSRLYYGADRVFRSDDRGNSWTRISDDLTRGLDRNKLPVMGKIQSPDAVSKNRSTSIYGNTTAISESPLVANLIYVGTDDGLVQVTEDGGENWRRIDAFPGVPHMSYVSFLYASRHDDDRVYALFSNHKNGDFRPYVLRSDDRGMSWQSIAGDLGEREICWSLAEDHEQEHLLFLGTEFGAYATVDGGEHWLGLAGLPTIAVRDVEIQRRENDLVLGTFGRGFYVLDDYTPLRELAAGSPAATGDDATIFGVRDPLLYVEGSRLGMRSGRGFQGASYFTADNPPFGAILTFELSADLKTLADKRREDWKDGSGEYPSIDDIRAEQAENAPRILLEIRDDAGQVVRRLKAPTSKGVHRMAWDLRYPTDTPVRLTRGPGSPWSNPDGGALVAPGTYSVTVVKEEDGTWTELAGPVAFDVVPLDNATFAAEDREAVLAFQRQVGRLQRAVRGASGVSRETRDRLAHLREAATVTPGAGADHVARVDALTARLDDIDRRLSGDRVLGRLYEPVPPSISSRVGNIVGDQFWVTSPPTRTQREQYGFAAEAFGPLLDELRTLVDEVAAVESELADAGAPWTPGRFPTWGGEGE